MKQGLFICDQVLVYDLGKRKCRLLKPMFSKSDLRKNWQIWLLRVVLHSCSYSISLLIFISGFAFQDPVSIMLQKHTKKSQFFKNVIPI